MSENHQGNDPPPVPGVEVIPNNSSADTDGPIQLRRPYNLQDILRITTQLSAPNATQRVDIVDAETRRFLSSAISAMTANVVPAMYDAIENIELLLNNDQYDEDDCDKCFDFLLECVGKIDTAIDYCKIGGFKIFELCSLSASTQMRWRICELMAEVCQNNPFCQEKCIEDGHLERLLSLIDGDSVEIVRVKALYALSCIVRENENTLAEFSNLDGFSVILRALQSDSTKLKIKSSFFLSSLCLATPKIKDEIIPMGFVEQIIGLILQNKQDVDVVEHLLSVLNAIIKDCDIAMDICRKPDFELKAVLEYFLDSDEVTSEVIVFAKEIHFTLFDSNDNSVEEDR